MEFAIDGVRCSSTSGHFLGASGASHNFFSAQFGINLTHREVARHTEGHWESSTILVVEMPSHTKLKDAPPTEDIDPYVILKVQKNATEAEIRKAYKSLALVQHPDKVDESERPAAHIAFQVLAHAYAILSDPDLRKRYDATGNTSLSETTFFNWADFYADLYADLVTPNNIANFAEKYKGSDQEAKDVLDSYSRNKGSMTRIYETVLLSNPIEDEDRFRIIIDEAIAKGTVPNYAAYDLDIERQKEKRIAKAKKERANFEKIHDKYGPGNSLDALILQRHKSGATAAFLENLENKYAEKSSGKKRKADSEPSEAAFAATAARARKNRASAAKEEVEDEEDGEEDKEDDDVDDDYEEEEAPKAKGKKKAAAHKGQGKGRGRKTNPNYGRTW
ncbi:hypothetical protein MMC30_001219 [Trapelia coarctata]|nr:hypothetical protein [Trapelia coarctata]